MREEERREGERERDLDCPNVTQPCSSRPRSSQLSSSSSARGGGGRGGCSGAPDEEMGDAAGGALYGDEKVANREIRVWHGATENGP